MRIDWRRYWWQPGFAAAFLAMGLPYWLIPYNRLNLPDALLGAGLLFVFAAAALARAFSGKPFIRVVAVMSAVAPAVVMTRVVFDGVRDAGSHNLWPLEVVIALAVGGVAALAGAVLGSVVMRLWPARDDDGQSG